MDSRNRLWWVMGGVGLLLVVVLTGGLYWLSPVDTAVRSDLTLPRPQHGAAPFEYVAGQSAAAGGVHGAAGAGTPPGGAQTAVTDQGTLQVGLEVVAGDSNATAAEAAQPAASVRQPMPRVTVDTQAPSSPAMRPAVRAIPTSGVRATAPAATKGTPAAATSGAGAGRARSAPVAKLAPPALLREFWVQVGSFASRSRADALGQRLSDQGIVSRVTTRASDAEVFFRVRVGPYASRVEAEKFLAWVQKVDGLDGSYISEVRNAGG